MRAGRIRTTARRACVAAIRGLGLDRTGNTTLFTAMMFTGVAGAAGLATDVGYWYAEKAQVQNVADAAAVAAAAELSEPGGTSSQAVAAALDSAATNGFSAATGATVDASISADGKTVTASISTEAPRFFSKLFLAAGPTLSASATATVLSSAGSPKTCIYALNPTASGAVDVNGNAGIYTPDCAIQVNSSNAQAVTVTGNASIQAAKVCVVGGTRTTGNARIVPTAQTGCPPVPDPLAQLPPPPVGGCDYSTVSVTANNTATLRPGVYCGGISLSGNARVTLEPGTYVIKNGSLEVSGNASISGDNVGFYLVGTNASSSVQISGNGDVRLTAPTSGAMQGILFWQDAAASDGGTGNKVTGNGNLHYEGTLYFPGHEVFISGNGRQATSPWTMLIADTIKVSGNAYQANADFEDSPIPVPEPFDLKKVVLTD